MFFSLTPLVGLSILAYHSAEESLQRAIGLGLEETAFQAIKAVDGMAFFAEQDVKSWAASPVLQDILTGDPDGAIGAMLSAEKRHRGVYSAIHCADGPGRIAASSDADRVGGDVTGQTWFEDVVTTRDIVVQGLYHDPIDGGFSVSVSAPIFAAQDTSRLIGVLSAQFQWSELSAATSDVAVGGHAQSETGYVVLINQRGYLLTGPDFLFEEAEEGRSQTNEFSDLLSKKNYLEEGSDSAMLALAGRKGNLTETPAGRREVMIGYAGSTGHRSFKGTGWAVLVIQDAAEALLPVSRLRAKFIAIIASISVITIMVAFLVSRKISGPVQTLTAAAQALSRGDFDHPVNVDGPGEIGALARAFTVMRDEVGAREADRIANRAMIDVLPDSVIRIGREGGCYDIGAGSDTGLSHRDSVLPATAAGSVLPPEVVPTALQYARAVLETGERQGFEYQLQMDGLTRTYETRMVACGPDEVLAIVRNVTDRKELEAQLIQARKLESIGQLAAGIAHEINTPTQYVGDNIRFLDGAFAELRAAMTAYERLLAAVRAGQVPPGLVAEVEQTLRDVDLEYLEEETPHAIEQSLDGLKKVTDIVGAMKEFSHPGQGTKELADLKRIISNTITVARNEWKYVANVTTDFADDLPLVPCQPSLIGQTILNLIVNAAHAIADVLGREPENKGTITISARRAGDTVEIRVGDTGTGIPESVRDRIFDPFFTTKNVGKGSGQGLAIARSTIVDKHGGTLECESEAAKGTTFIIRLPMPDIDGTEEAA